MKDKSLSDFLPDRNTSYFKEFQNSDIKKIVTKEEVIEELKKVMDPEIPVNIVALGLIYNLSYEKRSDNQYYVKIKMTLTAPGCGKGPAIAMDVETKIKGLSFVQDVLVEIVWDPIWNQDMMTEEAKLKLGML